jgi:hypothetical protein
MGFVHPRIRIESLVFHDAVDQVVNHRSYTFDRSAYQWVPAKQG